MTSTPTLYLASKSPRRSDLLKQIGIDHQVLRFREAPGRAPDFDETPQPGETPDDYVMRVAQMKAQIGWMRVLQRGLPFRPLLAADTTVTIDGHILGKPANPEDARAMLSLLSGRVHYVLTAVAVANEREVASLLSVSEVAFRVLAPEEIDRYVASGEPMDKAGSYGIQGRAGIFVSRLAGSYTGVMGLPVYETAELLGKFGVCVV